MTGEMNMKLWETVPELVQEMKEELQSVLQENQKRMRETNTRALKLGLWE